MSRRRGWAADSLRLTAPLLAGETSADNLQSTICDLKCLVWCPEAPGMRCLSLIPQPDSYLIPGTPRSVAASWADCQAMGRGPIGHYLLLRVKCSHGDRVSARGRPGMGGRHRPSAGHRPTPEGLLPVAPVELVLDRVAAWPRGRGGEGVRRIRQPGRRAAGRRRRHRCTGLLP